MKSTLKMFGIIIVLLIGLVVFALVKENAGKLKKAAKEPNAVDHFIGKTQVDIYLDVKDKADTFNIPALRTAIKMFRINHGRYPRGMKELENSEEAHSGLTRDQHGKLMDLKILKDGALITSPGSDRIMGTTDDAQYKINL
ncbi:hypothetical protein GF373_16105 [bacterium]|nr:hypothetical protein [bacterium]